jgi:hypothetical protein
MHTVRISTASNDADTGDGWTACSLANISEPKKEDKGEKLRMEA